MNKFDIHFVEQEEVDTNCITKYSSMVSHNNKFNRYIPIYKYVQSTSGFSFRTGWIQINGNVVSNYRTSDLIVKLNENNVGVNPLFATVRTFENHFINFTNTKYANYDYCSPIRNITGYHTKMTLFLRKGKFSGTVVKYNVSKNYPKREEITLENKSSNDFKNTFYKKKEIRMIVTLSSWAEKNNQMTGVQLYVPILEVRYPDQKVTDMAESVEQKNTVDMITI